MNSTLLSLAI